MGECARCCRICDTAQVTDTELVGATSGDSTLSRCEAVYRCSLYDPPQFDFVDLMFFSCAALLLSFSGVTHHAPRSLLVWSVS